MLVRGERALFACGALFLGPNLVVAPKDKRAHHSLVGRVPFPSNRWMQCIVPEGAHETRSRHSAGGPARIVESHPLMGDACTDCRSLWPAAGARQIPALTPVEAWIAFQFTILALVFDTWRRFCTE